MPMDGPPGTDSELEWQLEAQDLRVVKRWLDHAAAGGGLTIGSAPSDHHVDTYLDTADRRLDRGGFSVRLRRRSAAPVEAALKSLDGGRDDGLKIRLELEEELDRDEPEEVELAPGPVGRRVRTLIGSRKLVPLFDLDTRRRVFPLTDGESSSGE